jgi:hypothetical protein
VDDVIEVVIIVCAVRLVLVLFKLGIGIFAVLLRRKVGILAITTMFKNLVPAVCVGKISRITFDSLNVLAIIIGRRTGIYRLARLRRQQTILSVNDVSRLVSKVALLTVAIGATILGSYDFFTVAAIGNHIKTATLSSCVFGSVLIIGNRDGGVGEDDNIIISIVPKLLSTA